MHRAVVVTLAIVTFTIPTFTQTPHEPAFEVAPIANAFNIRGNHIVDGPPWLASDRFDVNARAPENTPDNGWEKRAVHDRDGYNPPVPGRELRCHDKRPVRGVGWSVVEDPDPDHPDPIVIQPLHCPRGMRCPATCSSAIGGTMQPPRHCC
jgi:uncharacterized protein DUF3738